MCVCVFTCFVYNCKSLNCVFVCTCVLVLHMMCVLRWCACVHTHIDVFFM